MSVCPLLAALVDDAGLFPPEQLPMEAALDRHRHDEQAGHPMLTHRFLCSASRLSELRAGLQAGDRLRLAIVVDTGLAGLPPALADVADEQRLVLEAVELPLPNGTDQAAAAKEALASLATLTPMAFIEAQRGPGWLEAVRAIAEAPGRAPRGAKVRCGGATADHFPSPAELASFIHACARAGVPFKASAGLHRAVRARDERTGFIHHGFLNLVVAAARAAAGADPSDLAAVLSCEDAEPLVNEAKKMGAETAAAARSLCVAYGSCSTSEPIEEAAALGLVAS